MSGMIQAAHFHASGEPDHDCSLCLMVRGAGRYTDRAAPDEPSGGAAVGVAIHRAPAPGGSLPAGQPTPSRRPPPEDVSLLA